MTKADVEGRKSRVEGQRESGVENGTEGSAWSLPRPTSDLPPQSKTVSSDFVPMGWRRRRPRDDPEGRIKVLSSLRDLIGWLTVDPALKRWAIFKTLHFKT